MPAHTVPIYEQEFFRFYKESVYNYPLEGTLSIKNNKLPEDVVHYMVYTFTEGFFNNSYLFI